MYRLNLLTSSITSCTLPPVEIISSTINTLSVCQCETSAEFHLAVNTLSSTTGAATKEQKAAAAAAVAQAEAQLAAAKALTGNSEAAVTNRANLLNLASGAALVAQKYGDQKDSAEAGRLKLIELRDAIIKNAVAQGMNKDEVTKYINEVLKIPASVPPTKAD